MSVRGRHAMTDKRARDEGLICWQILSEELTNSLIHFCDGFGVGINEHWAAAVLNTRGEERGEAFRTQRRTLRRQLALKETLFTWTRVAQAGRQLKLIPTKTSPSLPHFSLKPHVLRTEQQLKACVNLVLGWSTSHGIVKSAFKMTRAPEKSVIALKRPGSSFSKSMVGKPLTLVGRL